VDVTESPLHLVEAAALASFAPAWDALVDASALPSPFLRSWWLESAPAKRPLFLLALEGGSLVGGLALQEDRFLGVPRFRFLGAGPLAPDHLDVVARRGRERDVLDLIAAWFRRAGQRLVELRGAAEAALVAAALPAPVRREPISIAPYEPLPADAASYFADRPSRLQNTIRRAGTRLERAGTVHRVVEPGDAARALETLRSLHHARWGESSFLRGFSQFTRCAWAGMDRGELVIHELARDSEVVASSVMLEVAGRSSFYQSGRSLDDRSRGAGTVLMARIVEDACRRGSREFDLLRGNDPYKFDWARHQREVVSLLAAHGGRARLALLAFRARNRAVELLGPTITRLRALAAGRMTSPAR
jgi:CelD/BcsL family acetyltransferase involved in cellulose biosynthesis